MYLRNAEATRLAPLLRAIIGSDPSYVPQTGSSQRSVADRGRHRARRARPGSAAAPAWRRPRRHRSPAAVAAGRGGGALAGLIQADAATNSLIITAPEPLYRNIRAIIDKLDVRRAQVVIESLIVEMTADKAAEFGIQWQALGAVDNSGTGVIAGTNFGGGGTNIIGGVAEHRLARPGPEPRRHARQDHDSGHRRSSSTSPSWRVRCETTADANILSTPTIQTLDNEEAKFLVGQNIPLITGSYAAAGEARRSPASIRSRPSSARTSACSCA